MAVNPTLPLTTVEPRNPRLRVTTELVRSESRIKLSASDLQQFREDGYLIVPDLCNGLELDGIRTILRGLFEQQTGRDEGNHFDMLSLDQKYADAVQPQIVKPSLYAPALLCTPHFRRVQALAGQLLGPEAQFSFDHSILKPAGKAAATPWHQDEAHQQDPHFHHEQISFWMPLQDVSERNGCMRYVPGSNRGALLPHRSLNDDPRIHAIECPSEYFDESAALALPVPAGWCILHAGRTLHSALPNRSDADRLVYVLAFRGPPIPRSTSGRYSWLESKRTAGIERHQRWRKRGGMWVLLIRRLRQATQSRYAALPQTLRKLAHRVRRSLQMIWRGPQ